jgi:hypothetical protein
MVESVVENAIRKRGLSAWQQGHSGSWNLRKIESYSSMAEEEISTPG